VSGDSPAGGEATHPQTGAGAGAGAADARATAAATDEPHVRVVTGSPTDAELAAVHAVIAATLAEQAAQGVERLEPPVNQWAARAQVMRSPLAPGPGAWNATRGMRGC